MPNWCYNKLKITGTKGEMAKFKKDLNGKPLSFNKFVPMPPEIEKSLGNPGAVPEWYSWRCSNWGTKWDINPGDITTIRDEDNLILYEFDTAWSPPNEFIYRLAQLYPRLELSNVYQEEGEGFKGRYAVRGEDILVDQCKNT